MGEKMSVVIIERFTMPETRTVYGPFLEETRNKVEAALRQNGFTGSGKWWFKTGGIRATIFELRESLEETRSAF